MSIKSRLAVPALWLLVAAMSLLVICLPALNGPLVLDSVKLYELEQVVAERGALAVFHTPGFFGSEFSRIVSMASFVLNIQAQGELVASGLKLTNAVIHIVGGALVFLLTLLIASRTVYRDRAGIIAAGTSVLWLLSPTNFNVAMYAIQRMAQLAAVFTFVGLGFYIAGRFEIRLARRWTYFALAGLVCLPLAVLSKENGVLLIPLAFVVEIYILHPLRPMLTSLQLVLIALFGVSAGAVLLFQFYPDILNYHGRDFTVAERLLSQPRALFSYLQHVVLPYGSDTGIYSDDFKTSVSLMRPPATLPSLVAGSALLAFCVCCRGEQLRPISFGIAFFIVGHVIESSFIPLELYFLHRNYLPDYGIYFALCCALSLLVPGRRWLPVVLVLYSLYLAAISNARSVTWSSRELIAAAGVYNHPDSQRALSDYAEVAISQGEYPLALAAVNKSIDSKPSVKAYVQRLYIHCRSGLAIDRNAYAELAKASDFGLSIERSQALGNLLALYERGGCQQLRVDQLVSALDRLSERYSSSGADPWSVTYYADAFLYAGDQHADAHGRLRARLDAGHLRSGLYLLDLMIGEGKYHTAADMLNLINNRFSESRLQPYRETLTEFGERIGAARGGR